MAAPQLGSRRFRTLLIGIGLAAGLAYLLAPGRVEVETAVVGREPMRVTIDEDGRTRVKERYLVVAPLDGRLLRPAVKAGDAVRRGETVLAELQPQPAEMLDARTRAEARARLEMAGAAAQQARQRQEAAREAVALADHQLERVRKLLPSKSVSTDEFDKTEHQQRIAAAGLRAADFGVRVAEFEVDLARAALLRTQVDPPPADDVDPNERLVIRSPVDGRVFRLHRDSEQPVRAGEPLVELGDPTDLELEIDVLSNDAVRIAPGARVVIEQWGGPGELEARVRLVEPSGFTKTSALGVEEQRVNVIADFVTPLDARAALGDGFRVEARIVVWESDSVRVVPAGALFRDGRRWAVYVVNRRRAELRHVEIGRHDGRRAELRSGLEEGERVVLHPSDRVKPGVDLRVVERPAP